MKRLTSREKKVLEYLVIGMSDAQISKRMDIKTKTVNFHIRNIQRKFGINRIHGNPRVLTIRVAMHLGLCAFEPLRPSMIRYLLKGSYQ